MEGYTALATVRRIALGDARGVPLNHLCKISSFAGANDETCLRRGVAAASGLLAGLDYPICFDELDA